MARWFAPACSGSTVTKRRPAQGGTAADGDRMVVWWLTQARRAASWHKRDGLDVASAGDNLGATAVASAWLRCGRSGLRAGEEWRRWTTSPLALPPVFPFSFLFLLLP